MGQRDGAAIYRAQIERDLQAHAVAAPAAPRCGGCSAVNDSDARFCKQCGRELPR
jgi:rRNA maturation endonuclease Nob1